MIDCIHCTFPSFLINECMYRYNTLSVYIWCNFLWLFHLENSSKIHSLIIGPEHWLSFISIVPLIVYCSYPPLVLCHSPLFTNWTSIVYPCCFLMVRSVIDLISDSMAWSISASIFWDCVFPPKYALHCIAHIILAPSLLFNFLVFGLFVLA